LRAELAINRGELDKFKNDIDKKKQRLASRQVQELDYYFDFSGFNYRIVDPLIISGHFHSLLGADGVKHYFRCINDLNVGQQLMYQIF
jgi:hypothetical protein